MARILNMLICVLNNLLLFIKSLVVYCILFVFQYFYWYCIVNKMKLLNTCFGFDYFYVTSRKRAYIILTPLNPTFI